MAQDGCLEYVLHEVGQRALEHDEEGEAEQAERHRLAGLGVRPVEQQELRQREQGQQEQEEYVVAAVAIRFAMAQQGGQQHRHDGDEEELVREQEQRLRPGGAEPHAKPLEAPGCGKETQRCAMVAADLHPVFAGSEEEAAEHGPAEAEEHLVGMPLKTREGRRRRLDDACEHERPQHRQAQAGEAGQREEGTEADEPEGVSGKAHAAARHSLSRQRERGW